MVPTNSHGHDVARVFVLSATIWGPWLLIMYPILFIIAAMCGTIGAVAIGVAITRKALIDTETEIATEIKS